MRVLFFTGNIADSGGTERVCSVLAGALAERGYDVGILSLHEGSAPFFPVPSSVRLAALSLKAEIQVLLSGGHTPLAKIPDCVRTGYRY
jgi:hypothetical protein